MKRRHPPLVNTKVINNDLQRHLGFRCCVHSLSTRHSHIISCSLSRLLVEFQLKGLNAMKVTVRKGDAEFALEDLTFEQVKELVGVNGYGHAAPAVSAVAPQILPRPI